MRFTYDPRYNVAYIQLQEKSAEVQALRISEDAVLDIGPDGAIYGIELLNANEQLGRADGAGLVVIDEATGEQAELPLAL